MIQNELLRDTVALLRQHLDSASEMDLKLEDELMRDIGDLLHTYNLTHSRKMTILACYTLIYKAIHKHQELFLQDDAALGRGILDGDYLFGLYHRLAAGRQEWKLLIHLSLFNKRMQLALLKGQSAPALLVDLKKEIRSYLDRNCA